jgi:hypothetical protein
MILPPPPQPSHHGQPQPSHLLACWLSLELLAAAAVPEPSDQAQRFIFEAKSQAPLPWQQKSTVTKSSTKTIYYIVYIGQLRFKPAYDELVHLFPDIIYGEERQAKDQSLPMAAIVIDELGQMVNNSLMIPAFPWAYGLARQRALDALASFAEAEQRILNVLLQQLDLDGNSEKTKPSQKIFTHGDFENIVYSLTNIYHLSKASSPPTTKIWIDRYSIQDKNAKAASRDEKAPQIDLLNSFFIRDLHWAAKLARAGQLGLGLRQYLSGTTSAPRRNVLTEPRVLRQTLAPKLMPLSRWPGAGPNKGHPLVLMQQAAVNQIASELSDQGLVAVNGPPGTGKTTLLRDIIAHVVLERAKVLADFATPSLAFQQVKEPHLAGRSYRLSQRLFNFEIVVASSNNNAVENISREIPGIDAMNGEFLDEFDYFRTISDMLAQGNGEKPKDADRPAKDLKTWGLVAAILGNSSNRRAFASRFWFGKEDEHFRGLLQTALNDHGDPATATTFGMAAAGPVAALERWQQARADFQAKLATSAAYQRQAQAVHHACEQLPLAHEQMQQAQARLVAAEGTLATSSLNAVQAQNNALAAKAGLNNAEQAVITLKQAGGAWFWQLLTRLFWPRRYRSWRERLSGAVVAHTQAQNAQSAADQQWRQCQISFLRATTQAQSAQAEYSACCQRVEGLQASLAAHSAMFGQNLADAAFWQQADHIQQQRSPWTSAAWQEARSALFVASFRLQRAFIEAAAAPIMANLSVMVDVLSGKKPKLNDKGLMRSFWATFFLVIPVVSTTFASFDRLFTDVNPEELGWLLIDEAGQATPQAAVGAILRARRTVVVGDPRQIPPVVSLPERLVEGIAQHFAVSSEWLAPLASAQSCADQASWLGATIEETWVGLPLRVHRRCDSPMFEISNQIAYNGMMVQGKAMSNTPSPIERALGPSRWIDVPYRQANNDSKWQPLEGVMVQRCLDQLLQAGVNFDDIFIISPFRQVRAGLGRLLGAAWKDHIGTIHTFQGRENEAVILVMGAASSHHHGARAWVGAAPNIINVAVSRAKRNLYVIGDLEQWRSIGVVKTMIDYLSIKKPQ